MQRSSPLTFATLVAVPENRSALLGAQALADSGPASRKLRLSCPNPLFLHGPAGSGKTHLVSALAERWLRCEPTGIVTHLSTADWNTLAAQDRMNDPFRDVRQSDLLVLEDLQHLTAAGALALAPLVDELLAHGVPVVFTASVGPRHLGFAERLASRLSGGLVVGLEPLQAASRLAVLQEKAQRRQLAVSQAVLAWIADHTRSGRQIDSALVCLEALTRSSRAPLDVAHVAAHFEQALKPSIERIAQKVGTFFRLDLRQLCSGRRRRHILLPRQIGMYLARQLTGLTFDQIGAYFGGRDHSTVLHACRKVEHSMRYDAALSGNVRQLYLDLV